MASLSLEKTITIVMRRRVPEHVFQLCAVQDHVLLENIVHLAQQAVPELNITLAEAQKHGEVYTVRIPANAAETSRCAQCPPLKTRSTGSPSPPGSPRSMCGRLC